MKLFSIFLIFLISCGTIIRENTSESFYKRAFELIRKDINKDIIVSDSIYHQNLADFSFMIPYKQGSSKLEEKLKKQDKKYYFKAFKDENLLRLIQYKEPKLEETNPILFFSKPENDTLVAELFYRYQDSKSLKDYHWFGESKAYLFLRKNDTVILYKSFVRRR